MTQTQQILKHLKSKGSITPVVALSQYGCFRLAARIHDLRAEGHNIQTQDVKRNGKHYAMYYLP